MNWEAQNLPGMDQHLHLQDLLLGHSPSIQEIALQARDLILAIQPTAHQEVEKGWGGYWLFKQVAGAGNTVCWLSLHKKHVSLGFSQGTELDDPAKLLEGTGKHSRQLKLKSQQELHQPELIQLIAQAWERQPDAATLEEALARVRALALSLPETSEKLSHGHPTFLAGKRSFAVYGIYSPSLAFKPDPTTALDLPHDPRFFPTPYMAQNGWWSLKLNADCDWTEVQKLLQESYLQVATRKMQNALRQPDFQRLPE